MNLTQNPFTLLPKFFGLYCYQSANKNIRFVIMNNLIPTNVTLHEKYDLKGSIYKRKASEEERKRELPTLKDNDFKSLHQFGLILEPFFYDQLMQTIEDDVRVNFYFFGNFVERNLFHLGPWKFRYNGLFIFTCCS
jgi:1-phosphatidylinositol-4-phosphate 5-kinase